jgi:aerobic-type carbon monoxide dehydrogenase small subunit (CoxS/CutS family)
MIDIVVTLNGSVRGLRVRSNETLLEHLRESLGLKGTVEGCGVGVCGSCTVLVDGDVRTACLTLAADVDGHELTTIEGLGTPTTLDPIQQAFLDCQAFQCGFCTSGMILAAKALVAALPRATEEEVREYLAGNLCRCGTYAEVIGAVLDICRRHGEQTLGQQAV